MDNAEFRAGAVRLFPDLTHGDRAEVMTNYFPVTANRLHRLLKGSKSITPEFAGIMKSLLRQRFGVETSNKRPVILGECDHYTDHKHHVYFPTHGLGATFWNLLAEKNISQSDYLRAFDRITLAMRWPRQQIRKRARRRGPEVWESLQGRFVMLVDQTLPGLLDLQPMREFEWTKKDDVWFFTLPPRETKSATWDRIHDNLAIAQRLETLYLHYISAP